MTTRHFCLILASTLAMATDVAAQTSTVPVVEERVVVTATLSPVDAASVARTTTIVTADDMDRLGLRSLIEALRFVPGVDARARGPRDVQTDFSIRGATFGQNLMLADGIRLNDSQSGHHNGELPIPAIAIDRIEIVAGAGSAVHGADALGGTINVITRRGDYSSASAAVGEHGYVDAQAVTSGGRLPRNSTATAWASRSSGFMFDRDFAQGGASFRTDVTSSLTFDVRHQRRAFGANGFYGASPSKEWTDQTIVGSSWHRTIAAWTTETRAVFRNHGDHFRWDIARPGFAENRHRTNAVDVSVEADRAVGGTSIAWGGSASGDWVRSTNLGNHRYGRGSLFAELRRAFGSRVSATTGLRYDAYSNFGSSWSPSVGLVVSLSPAIRVRTSAARAFRVPTFTELYYTDPNNLGSSDLEAEHGWAVDGGVDWTSGGWSASASTFGRWDAGVIDWVRATSAERWRSANVRDVTARGVEASVTRAWRGAFVRASFAGLHLDAPVLPTLSKYVLEYSRRQIGFSISTPTGFGTRLAVNVDHRFRRDGQQYELVGARVSRRFGRVDVFVDGTNLLGERYQEIVGVDMPGRWLTAGVTIK